MSACAERWYYAAASYSMKDVTSLNIRVAHDIRHGFGAFAALFAGKSADHRCAGQRENNATAGLHPDTQSDGTMSA